MPLPEFSVPQERVEDVSYYIETAGERATELKPVLENILNKILDRERRLFETRGASGGVYWAPLKATTILRKRGGTFKRPGRGSGSTSDKRPIPYPDRPLWRYGDLMRSLSERGAPNQIIRVDDDGLLLQSRHDSAAFHTTGTSRMPARPPLVIAKRHAQEYTKDLNDFIFGND